MCTEASFGWQALEAALDTYSGLVTDLRIKADDLCDQDLQGASEIRHKQVNVKSMTTLCARPIRSFNTLV